MRKITIAMLVLVFMLGLVGCSDSPSSSLVGDSSVSLPGAPSLSQSLPATVDPVEQMAIDAGVAEENIPAILDFIARIGDEKPFQIWVMEREITIDYNINQLCNSKSYRVICEAGQVTDAIDGFGLYLITDGVWNEDYFDYSIMNTIELRDDALIRLNECISPNTIELQATELEPYKGWGVMIFKNEEPFLSIHGIPTEHSTFCRVDILPEGGDGTMYLAIYLPVNETLEFHSLWYGSDRIG